MTYGLHEVQAFIGTLPSHRRTPDIWTVLGSGARAVFRAARLWPSLGSGAPGGCSGCSPCAARVWSAFTLEARAPGRSGWCPAWRELVRPPSRGRGGPGVRAALRHGASLVRPRGGGVGGRVLGLFPCAMLVGPSRCGACGRTLGLLPEWRVGSTSGRWHRWPGARAPSLCGAGLGALGGAGGLGCSFCAVWGWLGLGLERGGPGRGRLVARVWPPGLARVEGVFRMVWLWVVASGGYGEWRGTTKVGLGGVCGCGRVVGAEAVGGRGMWRFGLVSAVVVCAGGAGERAVRRSSGEGAGGPGRVGKATSTSSPSRSALGDFLATLAQ